MLSIPHPPFMYHIAGYFHWVLIFVVNQGAMKFSTHKIFHHHFSAVLHIWTSDVLSWLFFATCASLTVPLVYRDPILKLSCMSYLRKWTEKWRRQKQDQQNRASISRSTEEKAQVARYASTKFILPLSNSAWNSSVAIVAVLQYWPPKYFCQWRSQDIADARAQHGHTTFVRTSVRGAEAFRGVWGLLPQKILEFYSLPGRFWGYTIVQYKSLTANSRTRGTVSVRHPVIL